MEMLRERIKGLEQKIMEMIRHGQENVAIAERLHRITRQILLTAAPAALPEVLLRHLKQEFVIPQAALRLWGVDEAFAGLPFTEGVSDDVRNFTASLSVPYCGVNAGFEAMRWLDEPDSVLSTALIPLRAGGQDAIGLLVLASPDPSRYTAELGNEFLLRIGEIASAALSRLLPVN